MAPSRNPLNSPPLSSRHELVRKALHLAAAVFPVTYSLGASRSTLEAVLAVTSALALLIEGLRRASLPIAAAFEKWFGSLLRQHERHAISSATWLSLSCFVAVVVLSRNAAIAALWCATVGDPAATIAGRWRMKGSTQPSARDGKTLAGSLACVVVSFAGVWTLAGYPPATAVAVAVAAALAESWPLSVDDNIRVAGASGAIAQLLA